MRYQKEEKEKVTLFKQYCKKNISQNNFEKNLNSIKNPLDSVKNTLYMLNFSLR